jgi:hypothetical protein
MEGIIRRDTTGNEKKVRENILITTSENKMTSIRKRRYGHILIQQKCQKRF